MPRVVSIYSGKSERGQRPEAKVPGGDKLGLTVLGGEGPSSREVVDCLLSLSV